MRMTNWVVSCSQQEPCADVAMRKRKCRWYMHSQILPRSIFRMTSGETPEFVPFHFRQLGPCSLNDHDINPLRLHHLKIKHKKRKFHVEVISSKLPSASIATSIYHAAWIEPTLTLGAKLPLPCSTVVHSSL